MPKPFKKVLKGRHTLSTERSSVLFEQKRLSPVRTAYILKISQKLPTNDLIAWITNGIIKTEFFAFAGLKRNIPGYNS